MIRIGKVKIDETIRPKIIAEISGNHDGKLLNALKLVKSAAKNGADLIKIQTYQPGNLTLNSDKSQFIIRFREINLIPIDAFRMINSI